MAEDLLAELAGSENELRFAYRQVLDAAKGCDDQVLGRRIGLLGARLEHWTERTLLLREAYSELKQRGGG